MTKITYNGKTTELADGYIATLPCKDLKMETDVVVEAPEPAEVVDSPLPIEVSTEAEMTALLESGEVGGVYKYTGETTDAYENGALYVLEEETASLISFTIDGTSYQAEEDMTWAEWCESDYNNSYDSYRISGNYIYRAPGMIMYYISVDGTASGRVLKTNKITDGYVYNTYKQEINNN